MFTLAYMSSSYTDASLPGGKRPSRAAGKGMGSSGQPRSDPEMEDNDVNAAVEELKVELKGPYTVVRIPMFGHMAISLSCRRCHLPRRRPYPLCPPPPTHGRAPPPPASTSTRSRPPPPRA